MKMRYTKPKQRILQMSFSALLMLLFIGGIKAENILAKKPIIPSNRETKYLKYLSDTGDIEQKKTDKTKNDIFSVSGEEDIEEAIVIEAWMLNANDVFWSSFDAGNIEEEIEIEEWMTDLSYWQ